MEDILGYIIIFGLIITFTWIYFSKNEKSKTFSLTKKVYSFGWVDLKVRKKGSETDCLLFEFSTEINNPVIKLELIKNNRTIEQMPLPEGLVAEDEENMICINYDAFKDALKEKNALFDSFRFTITGDNDKKLKTGIVAFNKRYSVFVPDTGHYN